MCGLAVGHPDSGFKTGWSVGFPIMALTGHCETESKEGEMGSWASFKESPLVADVILRSVVSGARVAVSGSLV